MSLLLKHQSVEQFVIRLRAAYRDSRSARTIAIARWIIGRIQAGDITEAQLRTAFDMNLTQWSNFKIKMQNLISSANYCEAAIGE